VVQSADLVARAQVFSGSHEKGRKQPYAGSLLLRVYRRTRDAAADQVLHAIEKCTRASLCLDNETMSRVFTDLVDEKRTHKINLEAEKQRH
jgi:hypothetical protein